MNPLLTHHDIEEHLDRALTDKERTRVNLDLDSIYSLLELHLNQKIVSTQIDNEPHIVTSDKQKIAPFYPVRTMLGGRVNTTIGDLDTAIDQEYLEQGWFRRGDRVFLSYITEDAHLVPYHSSIKSIILDAVINGVLTTDVVRYGVLSGYSVEGTSIQFNNKSAEGKVPVTDLTSITRLRRRVIV